MTAAPIVSEDIVAGKAGAFAVPHVLQLVALNVRLFNAEHPSKAELPIEVTDSGIARDVRRLHPSKADCPIIVTELGMTTERRLLQSSNAYCRMDVTEVGITTEVNLLHPINARSEIVLTVPGMLKLPLKFRGT